MKATFILLILSVCFTACIEEKDKPEEIQNYINVNDPIPDFTVKNADGKEFKSGEFKNHVGLLVFFVTTCPDCERELPKIDSVWTKLKDQPDFKLVTISRSQEAQTVSEYWNKQKFTMPVYLDPDRKTFSLFANSTVPRIYLINPEGIVTWMAVENMELSSGQLLDKIQSLINK